MFDILLIVFGILILLVSLAGCVLPILPGPPLTFVALLLLHFTEKHQFTSEFLIIWASVAIIVTIVDNLIPIWGTKKYGGSKKAVWGSAIGLVIGLFFFPPLGLIVGAFMGAVIGEMSDGKNTAQAFRAGFGAFIGFVGGTLLKLIASGMMTFYFFKELI